jgi:gluconolactonase
MRSLRRTLLLSVLAGGAFAPRSSLGQGPGTPSVEGRITRRDPRFDRLIPADARLELVLEGHEWAEGPLWDRKTGCLLFSDVIRNIAYRWCEGTGETVLLKPSGYTGAAPFAGREPGSNGLAFDANGLLLMAEHGDRRISRLGSDGRKTTVVDRYQGKRINSTNDLILTPAGDLLFTDPPWGLPQWWDDPGKELPFSGVYRLQPDGELAVLTRGFQAPNGIGLSPDGKTLFVSESKPEVGAWYALPVRQDGSVGPRRKLLDAVPWSVGRKGVPDGLKLDRESHLFGGGPGGVYVIHPDGTLLGIIETGGPASNTAWGGDGSTLYITAGSRILRIRTTTKGAGW